ncbi:Transposable element Tcb1 transposase [Folsomia candida]|uniref:Transposable element Tcb1 transposase n=1 Tax=Folsomia candida TaxID=158441 RepID=A0A226EAA6_FOLCA|nr:Transposable element Tcb1 transposase [Folsomia candida]
MKYLLISGVIMIWSKLNEIDFMKQIGEEYPEIKLPMTSSDRKICHEQFDAMKHRQNPDTGLSIKNMMASTRKEIPIAIRDLVIQDWKGGQKGGLSQRQIGTKYKLARTTIQTIIKNFRANGSVQNKVRSGRKPILAHREVRHVLNKVNVTPSLSAPKLSTEIKEMFDKQVSPRTIQRTLNKGNLKSHRAVRKPLIVPRNATKRVKFARDHISKPQTFWDSILWTDESKFNVFGSDGRRRVWRYPKEALNPKNLNPTVKHGGGSVMVWGCMASSGAGKMEFVDGIMDQYKYQGILDRNIQESVRKLGLGRRFVFQQDNDPKHSAKSTMEYFKKKKFRS